jgi:hypothetical protein
MVSVARDGPLGPAAKTAATSRMQVKGLMVSFLAGTPSVFLRLVRRLAEIPMNRFLVGVLFHIVAWLEPALTRRKVMIFARLMRLNVCAVVVLGVTAVAARAEDINDYPTAARAEYVFGCMKANGESRQSLDQCSCSVDVVASLLPYDRYITAETVLSMAQVQGNLGTQFRSSEQATNALNDLRRAQAEAEVRCF